MTESEIRRQIAKNSAAMKSGTDAGKALLQTENEGLAKQLDTMTGGKSVYDGTTGTWNLSASTQGAVDRYLDARTAVENSVYGGYDPEKDSSYQALKKQYLRNADRAQENILGDYAAQTGGYASTAAIAAAQQQGDIFRGQLADRQVELADQDYNRYLSELSAQQNLMSVYGNEAEKAAQQLAALGDYSAMAKLYGWTDAQKAAAESAYYASLYSGGSSGGGSGSGSSGGSSSGKTIDGMTESQILDKVDTALLKMPVAQAYAAIKNGSMTASQKALALSYFGDVAPAGDYSKTTTSSSTTSKANNTHPVYTGLTGDTTWLKSLGPVGTGVSSKGKF